MSGPDGATGSKFTDLGPRIIAAGVLAAAAALMLSLGTVTTAIFVAIASVIMQQELSRMARPETDLAPAAALAMGGITAVAVLLAVASPFWAVVTIVLGAVVLLPINDMAFGRITWGGFAFIGLACVGAVAIRGADSGLALLIWIILAVVGADVGGYFAGRIFGGPKLWPRVSPKKTWSGFLGGILLSSVVSAIAAPAIGGHIGQFVIFGVVIAAVALAGDLLESAAKRHFGVKDSGTILPGHGGLLDRFDGLGAVLALVLILSGMLDLRMILGISGT